jgi:hypothetical protein
VQHALRQGQGLPVELAVQQPHPVAGIGQGQPPAAVLVGVVDQLAVRVEPVPDLPAQHGEGAGVEHRGLLDQERLRGGDVGGGHRGGQRVQGAQQHRDLLGPSRHRRGGRRPGPAAVAAAAGR